MQKEKRPTIKERIHLLMELMGVESLDELCLLLGYKTPADLLKQKDEKESAKFLGNRVGTLQNWRYCNKGPVYSKVNASVRYLELELQIYKFSNAVLTQGAA